MKRTCACGFVLMAAVAAGGCNPGGGETLVPNPTYKAWASFEPGSSATLESARKTGGKDQKVRVTQRLVEKMPDHVSVERTIEVLGETPAKPPVVTCKVEPAMIDPADNPRTRPEAKVKELGSEQITVKGRVLPCRISEVQIHVEYGEPLPSKEDLVLRTSVNPEVPGGTVRIYLLRKSSSHDLELNGVVVDYNVVKGSGK